MMREPTSRAAAYVWHSRAMAGLEPPVVNEVPECGWFKRRLVKQGPFVPARIWLDSEIDPETGELMGDERLYAEVNGQWADPVEAWGWLCGNPISEAEFNYMTALHAHAERWEPQHPAANSREKINDLKTPLHF